MNPGQSPPQRTRASAAYLNLLATYLWYQHQGTLWAEARGQDSIVGRAILCHDKQFK